MAYAAGMPTQEPTGDLSFLEGHNRAELRRLHKAGIGEGDFEHAHAVPSELIDLSVALEEAGVTPSEFKAMADGGLL